MMRVGILLGLGAVLAVGLIVAVAVVYLVSSLRELGLRWRDEA